MARAAAARQGAKHARHPSTPLSIGQVLATLSPEFPTLTASKLRYLEDQGIVSPQRTSAGYRKFLPTDVERLRTALSLQRDQYLPLNVIREHLDREDGAAAPQPIRPGARSFTRAELLTVAGAMPQVLNDSISLGFFPASDRYGDDDAALLQALVALERHGIEPRHLRAVRQSAKRDADLIHAAAAPFLRRTDARSQGRAEELTAHLAARISDVHDLFLREALKRSVD